MQQGRSMRRLATSVFVLLAFVAAPPAGAQIAGRHDYGPVSPPPNLFIGDSRLPGPGIGRDLGDIGRRIARARESGDLSRAEARRLNRESRRIGRLASPYGRDGPSPSERAELEARARYLRDAVNRPGQTGATGRRGGGG